MPWGDPNVTIRRELSNGTSAYGPAGNPTIVQIQRSGILRQLRLLQIGSVTITPGAGTIAADVLGPWNLFNLLRMVPNDGSPVRSHSGYMAYVDMIARSAEGDQIAPDVVAAVETSADPLADIFAFPTGAGAGQDFRFYLDLPLTQYIRSIDDELGYWPLDNPQVQMNLEYTAVGTSSSSPFRISGNTATQFPYLADAGNVGTVDLVSPTIDVRRELYQVPVKPEDEPDLNWVVQTTESAPQGVNVNGATGAVWKATNNSGILVRLSAYIQDGGAGIAESKLSASNALNLKYGADENKLAETGRAAHARMHKLYGFAPPKGVYIFDFLGKQLSLQDTVNLTSMPEFRLEMNFASALNATNSAIRILQERLVPISRRAAR